MLICLYSLDAPAEVIADVHAGTDDLSLLAALMGGALFFRVPAGEKLPAARVPSKLVKVEGASSAGGQDYQVERAADADGSTLGDVWPVGGELGPRELTWRCATARPEPGHPLLVACVALREAAVAESKPWVARRLA